MSRSAKKGLVPCRAEAPATLAGPPIPNDDGK